MAYDMKDWWRDSGKEEQRINGMRNGAMRRAKKRGIKLSLAEIRVMTEEQLRDMCRCGNALLYESGLSLPEAWQVLR